MHTDLNISCVSIFWKIEVCEGRLSYVWVNAVVMLTEYFGIDYNKIGQAVLHNGVQKVPNSILCTL